jgi:hypothetical protein
VTAPTVASVSSVSSPQSGPVGSVDVTFSEPIDPSTFTTANLSLTLNGGTNLINSGVTVTQDSPATFTIGGLAALTAGDGNYTLSISAAGVSDFFGDIGTVAGSQSTSWATGTDVPVVVSVGAGAPTLRNTPVDTVDVVLSEPIVPGSFDYQALSLTLGGGPNLITSGVTVTEINPTTYQIGGLGTLSTADGNYDLTVSAGGLVDGSGNSGVGLLSESWTMNTMGPTVASLPTYIQSPRNIVVPEIDVIFSEPIVPSTFTYQNLTYSKPGGPNLILPSITIAQLSPTEFAISNFNNFLLPIDGTYTFTVSAAGVEDLAGNTGSGSASDTWVLVTAAPTAPTDLAIAPNTGATPGLTDTGAVTLTGTLPESGMAALVMDGNTDLGYANVTGTSFSMALNLPAGANQLVVTADDAAGNVSPSSTLSVFVDESPLQITSIAGPAPNPRNTAVGSVDVTFTEPINTATFTSADLTLTDNGGPNLITSAVTISLVSGSTYQIGGLAGLTSAEGSYTLTAGTAGVMDSAGSVGTGSVTTTWLMDTTAPTSTVSALPAQTTSTSFLVTAAGSDPTGSNGSTPSGIASFAIYVSTDGGPFRLFATVTSYAPSAVFAGTAGHGYGFYSVVTDHAGNVQPAPSSAQATVQVLAPLSAASIAAVTPNPRNTPVSTVNVTLSLPAGTGGFDYGALELTDNGGPNLITSSVTVTPLTGSTYQITGLGALTTAEGNYTLVVTAAVIQDQDGNPGTGSASTSWLMDTTPPTSHVNALATRGTSLSFAVSVTGSDGGNPPSGVASYDIYASTNGGPWSLWTTVPAANPTATYTGQSNTTYSFYSIAHDLAGNTESKQPAIEASTYLPDLTPPVTSVDGTTGANPSTVNTATGTFTLNVTGSDPGGGLVTYFEVFAWVDGGAYHEVGPYAIPAGAADSKGNYHSTIIYQGLTDGQAHTYSFYSIGLDAAGHLQSAPSGPNVTFANQVFAQPGQLQVIGFTVEHGSPSRSYVRYLDLGFNESDSQSGGELTSIVHSMSTSSPDILIYKYDINGDASSKTAVPLSSPTMFDVLDHAIEIDFGSGGIGGNPNTTAADGYYEVDIKLPNGQTAVHHFYRLLGDVNGDGIVDENDLNEIAASIGEASQLGWTPLSADVTGAGTVTAFDLTLATRSKGRKLGTGLSLG